MVVFVRKLSDNERRDLKKRARREVGRVSERIHMVLLSSKGYTVPQIAQIFECDEVTVRDWLARFQDQGVAGLQDRPRSGRPRKADAAARKVIRREIEKSPSRQGYLFTIWTVVALCGHLATRFGIKLSQSTLRRTLLALGYHWSRPRHELPKDPEAHAKLALLEQRLSNLPRRAAVLFGDECDVHLLPVLRAMWMLKGRQVRVPTPGQNRKRAVFGALEPATGRSLYAVHERKRSVEFIAFLEQLVQAYRRRPIFLVLDNASIHKAKAVQAWLAEHPNVELLWLPAYAGHEHNPVEKVWWRLKSQIAANRLHANMDALLEAVHAFFAAFTPQAALQLAA